MLKRAYRITCTRPPSAVATALRQELRHGSPWSVLQPVPGAEARIDDQGFRVRLAGNKLGPVLVEGTIEGSDAGSVVVFDVVQSLENLWVLALILPAVGAVTAVGFWPISPVLAIGSTIGLLAIAAGIVAFAVFVGPRVVGGAFAKVLSKGSP